MQYVYIGMQPIVKTGMLIIPPTRAAHFIDLPGVLSRVLWNALARFVAIGNLTIQIFNFKNFNMTPTKVF